MNASRGRGGTAPDWVEIWRWPLHVGMSGPLRYLHRDPVGAGTHWNGDQGTMAGSSTTTATPFVSKAPRLGYAPPLDGLRGWGMLAVMLAHGAHDVFASFAVSVDLFFVVSGFLITTLLLEERRSSGGIALKQFFARRALRLLPLLYLVLALTMLTALLVGSADLIRETLSDVIAGGTYTYHVVHPVGAEMVNGGYPETRPLVQLWSLSVEEHFYVVVVIALLFVLGRKHARNAVYAMVGVCIAAVLFVGGARLTGHVGPFLAWYQRPDALLVGVVLAFFNAHLPAELPKKVLLWLRRGALPAAVIGAFITFLGTAFAKPFGLYVPWNPEVGGSLTDGWYWGRFGYTTVTICAAFVTLSVARVPEGVVARFLSWKPILAVGRRSYAIYLIHVPLAIMLEAAFGKTVPALAALLYLPLLVLLVECAHKLVEKPIGRWRARLNSPNAAATGR